MTGGRDQGRGLVVLATGGTGGHVFPAEALADALAARGCRLAVVTDRRGTELGGRLSETENFAIRAGGLAGKGPASTVASMANLGLGFLQARALLARLAPSVVVGFGGYASVPTVMAASLSGVETAIHEQNAVLGRANRLLARRAAVIAISYAEVAAIPEAARDKLHHTGMPVRPAVAEKRASGYPALADDGPIELLILGGSQGASVFGRVVPQALGLLDESLRRRIRVTQQCRAEDLAATGSAHGRLGTEADLSTFFDDVPERIARAHLLVCRSGASTIAEITTIGRPAIFVPYPHAVDDHQSANAHAVDAAGGGWLIPENAFSPERLAERLTSLFSLPRILESAARAAAAIGRPDAAGDLADMVWRLLEPNGDGKARKEAA